MKKLSLLLIAIFITVSLLAQKLVRYDLVVGDTIVNYTGESRKAIAINGQIPAPSLRFNIGDTAEIHVHNKMHHETSIHWHGLILPNEQDGVPYLTTAPIKGNSTHVFRFPIVQSGTYWYHSHTMLQEQIGMYGAFIINDPAKDTIPEYTVLLSDWSDENPHQVERSLHNANDWYAIKKGATQSYSEGVTSGNLETKFENEFKRMMAMDVSDVYYQSVLLNGSVDSEMSYSPGQQIRLRVINGSSSTYFWLNYGGGKINVVASDGSEVEPVSVDRLIVGVSETYDVIVTIPDNGSFEFRATSEDRTQKASLWLGTGQRKAAAELSRLDYFKGMEMMNGMMTTGGNMLDMGMDMSLQQMDMNAVMYPELASNEEPIITLNYAMLKSPVPTKLPDAPSKTIHLELTGNMNRYIWTIDNKTVSETDKILIQKGEVVRLILTNNSMMRHPMHLHGHFFRVVNGQGDYAPLKTVLDIMPMETDTIEFSTSEDYGDWYFHCHILYHMMAGMGRIFTYENSPENLQLPDAEKALSKVYHDDRRFYLGAEIAIESNGSDGEITYGNTRWSFETEWRLGFNTKTGHEWESHFGRFIGKNQFLFPYVGWDIRSRHLENQDNNLFGNENTSDNRQVLCVGVQYILPWFIKTDLRFDQNGEIRLQISRDDIPVTPRIRLFGSVNTDLEYTAGGRYILTKYISISTHYDSDMKYGAGITLTY